LLVDYNRPFPFYGAKPGSVMAVPTSLAAVAILYNKRVLARLHLQVPTTLRAFEAALARARAAGYTPIGMGNADGWLGDDWYLSLVNALSAPSTLRSIERLQPDFSFRRPECLRAARTLQRWAQSGFFTPNFGGLDAQEGIDQFFHGKTLFQLVSSSQNPQILRNEGQSKLSIGVFAFPHVGGGTVMPMSGYLGWVVPKATEHRSLALDFIDSLLSPPTSALLERQGLLSAHSGSRGRTGASRQVSFPALPGWQREYMRALSTARPGVYLDAAPIANLNATMEANVQLLLQGYEPPEFLVKSLQEVYASRGKHGSTARIDGEF
jgi:raffinose/stachyose/melibiose transport system substrate-binding protein